MQPQPHAASAAVAMAARGAGPVSDRGIADYAGTARAKSRRSARLDLRGVQAARTERHLRQRAGTDQDSRPRPARAVGLSLLPADAAQDRKARAQWALAALHPVAARAV